MLRSWGLEPMTFEDARPHESCVNNIFLRIDFSSVFEAVCFKLCSALKLLIKIIIQLGQIWINGIVWEAWFRTISKRPWPLLISSFVVNKGPIVWANRIFGSGQRMWKILNWSEFRQPILATSRCWLNILLGMSDKFFCNNLTVQYDAKR